MQAERLRRLQAGSQQLLQGRDVAIQQARAHAASAAAAHEGRRRALDGMRATVAAAADGDQCYWSPSSVCSICESIFPWWNSSAAPAAW